MNMLSIAVLAVSIALVAAGTTLTSASPTSYHDLRYASVLEQTSEYTCGAAAVATLLTYFYGISTSESEILNLAKESMQMRGEERSQGHGFTAYDLKKGLEAGGIEA